VPIDGCIKEKFDRGNLLLQKRSYAILVGCDNYSDIKRLSQLREKNREESL